MTEHALRRAGLSMFSPPPDVTAIRPINDSEYYTAAHWVWQDGGYFQQSYKRKVTVVGAEETLVQPRALGSR